MNEFILIAEKYLDGQSTLKDLESWLAPRLANYLTDLNSYCGNLATIIELSLAEFSDEIISEDIIKTRLIHFFS